MKLDATINDNGLTFFGIFVLVFRARVPIRRQSNLLRSRRGVLVLFVRLVGCVASVLSGQCLRDATVCNFGNSRATARPTSDSLRVFKSAATGQSFQVSVREIRTQSTCAFETRPVSVSLRGFGDQFGPPEVRCTIFPSGHVLRWDSLEEDQSLPPWRLGNLHVPHQHFVRAVLVGRVVDDHVRGVIHGSVDRCLTRRQLGRLLFDGFLRNHCNESGQHSIRLV